MERFEERSRYFEQDCPNCEEAALMLGCSTRHFLRLPECYAEESADGLQNRRGGRVPKRWAMDAVNIRLARCVMAPVYRDLGFEVDLINPCATSAVAPTLHHGIETLYRQRQARTLDRPAIRRRSRQPCDGLQCSNLLKTAWRPGPA